MHGDDDSTVRLSQSEAMAKALKQHGVPNELVVIKDGEHSLLRPQMRLTLYKKLEAFLERQPGLAMSAPVRPRRSCCAGCLADRFPPGT